MLNLLIRYSGRVWPISAISGCWADELNFSVKDDTLFGRYHTRRLIFGGRPMFAEFINGMGSISLALLAGLGLVALYRLNAR